MLTDYQPKMSATTRNIRLIRPGITSYGDALSLQEKIADGRLAGNEPDTLIVLEHEPVITLGRNSREEHVLVDGAALANRGIRIERCNRGGEVTFHGPGQLVAYPILDIGNYFSGVRRYVEALEEIMILTCGDQGIRSTRKEGMPGVWLGPSVRPESGLSRGSENKKDDPWRKIGAVGVHISKGVSTHGLALNVTTDLSYFDLINPCGITTHSVTSMSAELEEEPDMNKVETSLTENFCKIFNVSLQAVPSPYPISQEP